ncbi:MAG: integration host factor subunit beta [Spirochaetaceae bacterium]|nr:integration host factor subunit beta [Spirochaetaceae bacterium]
MSSTEKLTKEELIDAVWERVGVERRCVKDCYAQTIDVIKQALSQGRSVELRGFGTFNIKRRKGKANARNPKTGEPVPSKPHGICAFKPGRELKLSVWDLKAGEE